MEEAEEIQKENILNDLKISKLIQQLNHLRINQNTYTSQKEYLALMTKVKLELEYQKDNDNKRYLVNLNRIPEFVEELSRKRASLIFYPKLSQIEKEFLNVNKYDYEKDKYNLFNNKRSPENTFVKEWQELQFNKLEESYIGRK